MKILLPFEVWVDVFAPISRRQWIDLLNEIGSKSFADDYVMPFLHGCGQITLGKLSFGGVHGTHQMTEEELPANIKDFESIEICAQKREIDCALMTTFFTNLRPLLSNVNLWCNHDCYRFDTYPIIYQVPYFLIKLLPLIDSIHSMHFCDARAFDFVHERFADKFFAAKVISINYSNMWNLLRMDTAIQKKFSDDEMHQYDKRIDWKPKMVILRKWLFSNGNDNITDSDEDNAANAVVAVDQPRILYIDSILFETCREEIDNISKEFMQSTKPTPFIVCYTIYYLNEEKRRNVEAIRHVNQTTNELLSVKCIVIEKSHLEGSPKLSAVFLHSHPILPNGEEHEGNMRLINQIVEKMPLLHMEDKFVYSPNRHINIYRQGRKRGE